MVVEQFAKELGVDESTVWNFIKKYPDMTYTLYGRKRIDYKKFKYKKFLLSNIINYAQGIYYPLIHIYEDEKSLVNRLVLSTNHTYTGWMDFVRDRLFIYHSLVFPLQIEPPKMLSSFVLHGTRLMLIYAKHFDSRIIENYLKDTLDVASIEKLSRYSF